MTLSLGLVPHANLYGEMDPGRASLTGRTAIVTGGGSGIGNAIARALSNFGASVVVADCDGDSAQQLAQDLRSGGGTALAVRCDVRRQADVDDLFGRTLDEFGRLDILVNNVGGTIRKLFVDMSESEWMDMLDLNLIQVFRCTRAAARTMIDCGAGGSIINVTTIEAYRAAPAYAPYAAAKAGVANFTRTLALELAPSNIRVNEIAPDVTTTPGLLRNWSDEERHETERRIGHIPRNRRGVPEDYGGAAVFLASDMSSWVTGTVLHVDGGTSASLGWRRDEDGYWSHGSPPQAYSGKPLAALRSEDARLKER
jgi:NAD(P)-dependent dehydrogenase (short-subunit alcohol dehydrogenase family)